jgi:hypothetical protein
MVIWKQCSLPSNVSKPKWATAESSLQSLFDRLLSFDFGSSISWAEAFMESMCLRCGPVHVHVRICDFHPNPANHNADRPKIYGGYRQPIISRFRRICIEPFVDLIAAELEADRKITTTLLRGLNSRTTSKSLD